MYGNKLRKISSNFYYDKLDSKSKQAHDFIFNKMIDKAVEGKYYLKFCYGDLRIPSYVFKLLENDEFYDYLVAEKIKAWYNSDKGEYEILWRGE